MKLTSWLKRAVQTKQRYPSLPIRVLLALVLSIDAIRPVDPHTGNLLPLALTEKAVICLMAILINEYIYRLHLALTKRFPVIDGLGKVVIIQFILGLALPGLLIAAGIKHFCGYTVVPIADAIANPVLHKPLSYFSFYSESLIALNLGYMLFAVFNRRIAPTKELAAYDREGNVIMVDVDKIWLVTPYDKCCLIWDEQADYLLTVADNLGQVYDLLDPEQFTLTEDYIIRSDKAFNDTGLEKVINRMIEKQVDHMHQGMLGRN